MIKSMTGYGKSSFESNGKKISIEVKSLNSKQCDLSIRSAQQFKEVETELRSIISNKLERGKIEVYINVEYPENFSQYSINKALYLKFHKELTGLAWDTQDKTKEYLNTIMRLPDVLKQEKEEANANEINLLFDAMNVAVDMLDKYRLNEGNTLLKDFEKRINILLNLLPAVEKFEKQRIENIKAKIYNSLLAVEAEHKIDKNRFEQELIYYLEKIDFTEEKIRLKQHCNFFLETIKEEMSNGKKLSFIAQEISREVNTLGSKANDFDIQKIVVEMKDELEKIKEQLANIL